MKNNPTPSNKSFGFFVSSILFSFGIYLSYTSSSNYWAGFYFGSALIFFLTLFSADSLAPLNKAWAALGQILGRLVSPIVLGLIFFCLITPVALIGRVAGRDPLRLKTRADTSYWIKREPSGPAPDSFRNQF